VNRRLKPGHCERRAVTDTLTAGILGCGGASANHAADGEGRRAT
jgi:hypothetical protein